MQNDCKNCIHLNVCAYVAPDIPTCDSFLSKDILDKIIATGNVNAISTEEIEVDKIKKEGEDDWVEINEAEYQKRKEMEVAKNGTD